MTFIRFTRIAAFAAGLLGAALALQAHAEDKPAEIRIAYPGAGTGGRPLGTGTFLATAQIKGVLEQEFKADGIKVKWSFFPGAGPAVNESFANGLVDFAGHGDLPLIVGRSTGLKHKIILSAGRFGNTYFVVPNDSEAKNLGDLKGKRLATFKGTAGQLSLARVLEKYGYTEKDFKVISMDNDTTKAALATKDIEGTLISPFDLEARGIAKRLFEIPRDPKITSVTSFWVSEDFEKKYPHIVQRVVNALVKQAAWDSDEKNRDPLFKLWGQSGAVPYSDYVKSWEGYTLKERNTPLLDDYHVASLKRSIDESKRYKLIRRDVDINGWIEPKYVNNAVKELKLEGYWPEFDANGNPKK
ncbi:sulfonate transport system substrate-binding protein [Andreprevotia lacus DSM 23236]|jgi:sulfonate transport system substrate-binding protein|uniref:Sulfonate transport system substrate-binding protein n=1 Tax=Andreprevotia lacus DSM 23236 TaxID=1121001 RepID=A0A1W1XV98_9NEIS|nr:ABC transporter substrate-binding protein [Andreprevotia lacus]SMC27785.1 sulfonate transport system substrate-binding protein [Andreprevotia lacus DSM 23236]